MNRTQVAAGADPYSYGQFGPEFQYFNDVNPALVPMAAGGRVHLAEGGMGGKGHGSPGGDRPSHGGGGSGAGGDTRSEAIADARASRASAQEVKDYRDKAPDLIRGAGSFYSPTGQISGIPNKHIQEGLKAFDEYKNRGWGWDALDFLGGPAINVEKPEWDKIGTYAGGTFHTGTSVPGVIGALGGMFAGVPMVGGPIGQWAGDKLGIPDVMHGGYGDIPDWAKGDQTGGGIHGPQGGTGNNAGFNGASLLHPTGLPQLTHSQPDTKVDGDDAITGADRDKTSTGRSYVELNNPYTYGQFGPEHQFFTGSLADVNMAGGGTVPGGASGGGQDDIIPAALAPNEHVIDADVVSALGDGNSDAGHAKIEQFKQAIRKHKRAAKPGNIPPMARSISEYMTRRSA
jgi:hypothetical protein